MNDFVGVAHYLCIGECLWECVIPISVPVWMSACEGVRVAGCVHGVR